MLNLFGRALMQTKEPFNVPKLNVHRTDMARDEAMRVKMRPTGAQIL